MGISMLGSIVSSILGGIANALVNGIAALVSVLFEKILLPIFTPIIKMLINLIIVPFLEMVFTLVNAVLSILWYTISIFILGLIDFVEVLFRILAGLETSEATLKLNGKSGDLLIQLLLNENIKNVFLSMCIVGVFLLVITTIFQIIKVEYTTEGAKNAKGPILNKAFKGLCNMIMVPALCICGVFIGNAVLELLDIATKPSNNTSISRMLFVTAAADAEVAEGTSIIKLKSTDTIEVVAAAIAYAMDKTFGSAKSGFNESSGSGVPKGDLVSDAVGTADSVGQGSNISSEFLSKNKQYFSIKDVTSYYDYTKINYLVLIACGCIILKTLYFACFGMIVRLYQCGMLFIISPVVIGMTPIRESGLSKWREEFIGQAISAYGVILALNIFFVLANVLSNISLTFKTDVLSNFVFTSQFMTNLLKTIIIIGGAVSIEKFSSQIGGYFGAKDAISQGKEMEKGVTDTAKKAVGTAVQLGMVATGVGGAAMGAVKSGAKGIAGGVKGLAGAMKDGAADGGGLGGALKSGASYAGKGAVNGVKGIGKTALKGLDAGNKALVDMGIGSQTVSEYVKGRKLKKDSQMANKEYDVSKGLVQGANADLSFANKRIEAIEAKKEANGGKLGVADQNQLDYWTKKKETAEKNVAGYEDRFEKATKNKQEADGKYGEYSATVESRRHLHKERNRQAGISFFKEKTFMGQTMSSLEKQTKGYEDAAAKEGGDNIKAAQEYLTKLASKAKEDAADGRNADSIRRKNEGQEKMTQMLAIEECNIKNAQLDLTAQSGIANLNNLQQRYNEAENNNNTAAMNALSQQMEAVRTRLADSLGLGAGDIVQDVKGNFQITGNYKINTSEIEKMLTKIFASHKGMNDKQAIEDAVKEAIQGKNAEQAKQIQEIFEKVLQRYAKS